MFETDYREIIERLDRIDPIRYGQTRNYLSGAVTRLSPYISRGVISTRQVAQHMLRKGFQPYQIESFLKELAWRDYFQQVWIDRKDSILSDLKQTQPRLMHHEMPSKILSANTGIHALDDGIQSLCDTGYMHNHMRMYIASTACNIGQAHWRTPAQWMYYHLLDADWASNALSWQWVAGSFSSKKYYCNQENINKYTGSTQRNTFLDLPYEALPDLSVPEVLRETETLNLQTQLPEASAPMLDDALPVYIYNFYNIDPRWDVDVSAHRVLLLEPSFFAKYPVCSRTIDFIIALSKNIEGMQVAVGEFSSVFAGVSPERMHYKEHPCNANYQGLEHARDWMFPEVKGYYPSFFAFWKKAERRLTQLSDEL